MREKLETLPLPELRAIAKAKGMKKISTLKKGELIDLLVQSEEEIEAEENQKVQKQEIKKQDIKPIENKTPQREPMVALELPRKDTTSGQPAKFTNEEIAQLDSGIVANGILEVMPDGYGFIRCENYMPGENDVYVSPAQIRKLNLKTGDIVVGNLRTKTQNEKFAALLYVKSINGFHPMEATKRKNFEDLTPIFPNKRLRMETSRHNMAMRIVDMISPIGKGQRGMIAAPPKAGKTTLLKQIAQSINSNNPEMHLIILLIDERPEEVTDIKESIEGKNVEVIYSTFDELPEHHKRVSEMVLERAKRLVEHKRDVIILLDSITRLARAYNLVVPPSGRTLSGGLDPAALHMPKRFFGAARNMREGGSLTILATALVETGSKMDDVIFEEFKGTGNMELALNRKLQEKRVFPAIDILKSGTRRDDLLLSLEEQEAAEIIRKATNGMKAEDAVEKIMDLFSKTHNNEEFVQMIKKTKLI
ncbi:MAG: transcription termination factor Rho [Lachnospiraceae bacterium]|jgi:transcription termination factor Rho|nr:transcription termination factor Rho [Lachnospiraceae bacterium]